MRPLKGPRPLPPPFFFSPSSLFRSRSAEIRRGQSRNFKGFRLRIRVISYINYAIRCLAFSKSSLIRTSRGDELHIHSLKAVSRIYLFNARSSTIFARHLPLPPLVYPIPSPRRRLTSPIIYFANPLSTALLIPPDKLCNYLSKGYIFSPFTLPPPS